MPATYSSHAPEKSENDKLDYRLLVFENGFEALLVSSKDARKSQASAAVAVGAGSFSDPQGYCEGLAHYLEHMLFMGSDKYPGESEMEEFLANYNGSSNAFTESTRTCFYFDIDKKQLHKALDMFASFFRAPLLKTDSAEREIKAIDSEFNLAQNSDGTRIAQLLGTLAREKHPYATFGWGNLKSLKEETKKAGVDLNDELKKFHISHYSAWKMRLCVYGIEPLDALEKVVVESFSGLPQGTISKGAPGSQEALLQAAGEPYMPSSLPLLCRIKPVKDVHRVSITWQLPPVQQRYKSKPDRYLSHLVGHEGAGSLLSWLKRHGLATDLTAGVADGDFESNCMCCLFDITVSLTAAGMSRWTDVVHSAFMYLDMLRRVGPQRWVHDEMVAVLDIGWRFFEEPDPGDYVQDLAVRMLPDNAVERPHVLKALWMNPEWDPDAVTSLLDGMTPERAIIFLTSAAYGRATGAAEKDDEEEGGDAEEGAPGGETGDEEAQAKRRKRGGADEMDDDADEDEDEEPEEDEEEEDGEEDEDVEVGEASAEVSDPHFDLASAGAPSVAAHFGTEYWIASKEELDMHAKLWQSSQHEATSTTSGSGAASFVAEAVAALQLPPKNHFIATDFSLQPLSEDGSKTAPESEGEGPLVRPGSANFPALPNPLPPQPKRLAQAASMRTWHMQDSVFRTPRSEFGLKFSTDRKEWLDPTTPKHMVMLSWLIHILTDLLNETAYLAGEASCYVSTAAAGYGLDLSVGGFSHKLPLLLGMALDEINALATEEGWQRLLSDTSKLARMNAQKEMLLRKLRNSYMRPETHAADMRRAMVLVNRHPSPLQLQALEETSLEALQQFAINLLTGSQVELLASGNITEEEAAALSAEVASKRPAAKVPVSIDPAARPQHPPQQCVAIPPGSTHVFVDDSPDVGNRNAAIEMFWQLGPATDAKTRVVADLLEVLMDVKLFDTLRTKQQLGYIASCSARLSVQVSGFSIWLTSSKASPSEIAKRVEEFLVSFKEGLNDEEQQAKFEEQVCALAAQRLEPPRKLGDLQYRAWGELQERTYAFDRRIQEARALSTVSLDDVRRLLDRIVGPPGSEQRAGLLICSVIGGKAKTSTEKEVKALSEAYPGCRVVSSKKDFAQDLQLCECLI